MTHPSSCIRRRSLLSRAFSWALCGVVGFSALCITTSQTDDAIANGETRTLSLMHKHTGETIHATFRRNGRYDPEVLKKLNWFLRDWRVDEPTQMDPALFDLVWEVYNEVGAEEPIHVVSAYRSPGTNAMLRRRSRAVAKTSQHIQGRAMDFHIPGVSMQRVREVGLMLQRGGIGYYPSGATFVHMDTGSVRHWPKVSREYLARLFPDGRTVHIPADGKPLGGYDLAFAEVRRRGGSVGRGGEDDGEGYTGGENGGVVFQKRGGGNFLTALFGGESKPEPPVRPLRGRAAPAPRPEPAEEPTAVAQAPATPTPAAPPAPGTFGAQLAAQQTQTPAVSATAPLPVANPNAAERPTVLAGLVAPLPMARTAMPGEAPQAQTTLAMAAMPLPVANPNARPATPALPPLIATGAQPAAEKPAQVLAYAPTPTEIDPLTTTSVQAGTVQSSARPLQQTAALRNAPPPTARTSRTASATPLVAPTMEGTRGHVVFASSAKTADVFGRNGGMVRPDPRQLKLIEQPAQIVDISFNRSTGVPTTDRFSGSAINPIPTMQFVRPDQPAANPQRRASL